MEGVLLGSATSMGSESVDCKGESSRSIDMDVDDSADNVGADAAADADDDNNDDGCDKYG